MNARPRLRFFSTSSSQESSHFPSRPSARGPSQGGTRREAFDVDEETVEVGVDGFRREAGDGLALRAIAPVDLAAHLIGDAEVEDREREDEDREQRGEEPPARTKEPRTAGREVGDGWGPRERSMARRADRGGRASP